MAHGSEPPAEDRGRRTRLDELQEQIERGQYHINPRAVADAMLRRLRSELRSSELRFELGSDWEPASPPPGPQDECS